MKIEEFKDYLVDKKDSVKNYVLDKKDNIKDSTKVAIATGLVVTTILGGAVATKGCAKNPEDLTSKEEVSILDKKLKRLDDDFEYDYLKIMKNHMEFVDEDKENGDQILYYAIDTKDYDKMFTLSVIGDNVNKINLNNEVFTIKKEFMDDESMKDVLDIVYDYVVIKKSRMNAPMKPESLPVPVTQIPEKE